MSSALAMASVTAVLKNLLHNELIRPSSNTHMGDITITALSPDRIPLGAEERAQLNLYLYRLTPNSGWQRTKKLGSHVGLGQAAPTASSLVGVAQAQGTVPTASTARGGQAQGTVPTGTHSLALDLHY